MNKHLLALRQRVEALSERDRLFLLAGCCVVIILLWWSLFFSVQQDASAAVKDKIKMIEGQKEGADKLIQEAQAKIDQGADPKLIAQKKNLEEQLRAVNSVLGDSIGDAETKQHVIDGIKALIADNNGLTLINLNSVSAPITIKAGDDKNNLISSVNKIFIPEEQALMKHDITLELQGNYFAVSDYLKGLEKLKIHFFFHDLNYVVTQYPNAKVTIKLHIIN